MTEMEDLIAKVESESLELSQIDLLINEILKSAETDVLSKDNHAVSLTTEQGDDNEDKITDVRIRISTMAVPDKIKLALLGNSVCRQLLIFDKNKLIPQFVLKNPRITAPEIEDFSRSRNVNESVLRTIANSKEWVKSYLIKKNLVYNPKTPGDISLKLLRYLTERDLKNLSRSKEVPAIVSVTARKRLSDIESVRNK